MSIPSVVCSSLCDVFIWSWMADCQSRSWKNTIQIYVKIVNLLYETFMCYIQYVTYCTQISFVVRLKVSSSFYESKTWPALTSAFFLGSCIIGHFREFLSEQPIVPMRYNRRRSLGSGVKRVYSIFCIPVNSVTDNTTDISRVNILSTKNRFSHHSKRYKAKHENGLHRLKSKIIDAFAVNLYWPKKSPFSIGLGSKVGSIDGALDIISLDMSFWTTLCTE